MLLDVGFFVSLLGNLNKNRVDKLSASFRLCFSEVAYYFIVVFLEQLVEYREQNNRFTLAFYHNC